MSILTMPVRGETATRNIVESMILGVVLTGLSYLVGVHFGWVTSINWLEAFAVFTSYACTYLCVMERRINYPIGAISTAAYCVLFYQWGLFASMAINGYLVFALVYGWFRWRSDDNTRPVQHLSLKWTPVYLLVTALGYLGVVLIASLMGGTLAWTDSFILAGTLLAQFLLDNKKIETWHVWAVVNVFAIYTYATAGLPLAAFQYVFFLANTGYGWYMWNRSMQNEDSMGTGVSSGRRTILVQPARVLDTVGGD